MTESPLASMPGAPPAPKHSALAWVAFVLSLVGALVCLYPVAALFTLFTFGLANVPLWLGAILGIVAVFRPRGRTLGGAAICLSIAGGVVTYAVASSIQL